MLKNITNFLGNICYAYKRDDFKTERAGFWFKFSSILIPVIAILTIGIFIYNTASIKNSITDIFIITIILTIIITTFIYNYYNLVDKYIKIKKQLNTINENIKDITNIRSFTEHAYELNEQFEKIDHIKFIWHEFWETLIKDKETGLFKNTAQTEDYINSENIISQQISLDLCDSVPGILTGLGLVGTFTAITVALVGFQIATLDTSVQNLLSGLSIKFISSLAGIITSILFITIKDKLLGNLKNTLYKVQTKFNRIFPRRTNESFLNEILIEMKEQTENMKEFFLDTGFQDAIKQAMSSGVANLKPEFDNIREAINSSILDMQEAKNELFGKLDYITSEFNNSINNLNNNISNNLSVSISNALGGLTNDFGIAIRELQEAMSEFKNMKQESSASLIENMVNELKSCIGNMQTSFTEAIVGGSGDTIGNLQKSLSEASNYLSNLQGMFTNFMNAMQEQVTKNSIERDESVNRVVSETIEKVSNVNQYVQNTMDVQNNKINEWINSLNGYISEIHSNELNVNNNYSDLLNHLDTAIQKQKDIINDNTDFIAKMISASSQLNNSTNNLTKAQNTLSDNLNNSNTYNSKFVTAMQEMNKLNNEANNQLENNIELIKNQAEVYQGINENTSHIISTLTNNINDFAKKSTEFGNEIFEEYSKKMGTELSSLHGFVEQQTGIIEDLSETLSDILEKK